MLKIYKSSAGSGKTYTLVKEYLRLALKGDTEQYRHILAITFTNKAANEMKERIISALKELSNPETESDLGRELETALSLTKDTLQQKAAALLQNILHNYADLSVSTIDSFVHRIIRSFAYDLHLSTNFEIEMDAEELLSMAVEKLLDNAKEEENSPVTKALMDFAENNLNEGKGWNLDWSLIRFAKELFNEDAYQHIDRLAECSIEDFMTTRDTLYAIKVAFESKIKEAAGAAVSLIQQNNLTENDFYQTRSSICKYFGYLATDPAGTKLEPNSYVLKTTTEGKWVSGKITEGNKARLESIQDKLLGHYNRIQEIRTSFESGYLLSKLLLKNIYSFMLLTEIKKMLDEYKKENNVLHISEFQERISHIVNEQDAPIIYERIGDWYDSILIDEFQDTSVLQWRNLIPLIENSQTKVKDSLIVGDGKQAIYRFRGGEVEQFAALPQIYQSAGNEMLEYRETAILNYGTEELHLNQNFRSRKQIIDFNNALYDSIAAQPEFIHKHIYHEQAQLPGKDKQDGYISIDFLDVPEEEGYDEALCYHVEAIIHQVRDRGYAWRDIAILSRTNDTGSKLASYLLSADIPVVSSESLLIGQSATVRALVSFLYYLADKDNTIKRSEIIYYCAPDHITHAAEVKAQLGANYSDFELYISSLTSVSFDSDSLVLNRLPELVQSLIRKFTFLQKEDSFIQFFQDEVLEYSVRNGNRISEFLQWWEENKNKKSIIYPQSMDAVRVLTIHKSKGLQYPVVILPDADFKLKNTKKYLWTELQEDFAEHLPVFPLPVHSDLEATPYADLYIKENADSLLDMVNMFYVATTRPEDRLYILSKKPAKEPENLNSITALIMRFLKSQNLWNGFVPYEFGDEATAATGTSKQKGPEEFVYSPVQNQKEKTYTVKISAEL
jgi:ATP-dependent exoDNAse (exonuclease V) beta subunit